MEHRSSLEGRPSTDISFFDRLCYPACCLEWESLIRAHVSHVGDSPSPSLQFFGVVLLLLSTEFVYHFPWVAIALKSDKASPAFSISVLYVRLRSRYVVLFVFRNSGIRSIWNAFSAGLKILATMLLILRASSHGMIACFDCSFSFYIHHFLILLYKNFYINSVRTRCSNHIRFTVI